MKNAISERKKLILETIVKEHLQTAAPVSSGQLVEKYQLGVSPATVRNTMMELEEEGYIYQPHTSAGRIPTQAAYELLLAESEPECKLDKKEQAVLDRLFLPADEAAYRQTAKTIAEMANGAVFWAFNKNDLYHTGISNLFAQPEFNRVDMVCDVSAIIDRLEDIIDGIFEDLPEGARALIGSNNPFGDFLSVVLVKYRRHNMDGLFGIIGPLRMDYRRNLALVEFIRNKFK